MRYSIVSGPVARSSVTTEQRLIPESQINRTFALENGNKWSAPLCLRALAIIVHVMIVYGLYEHQISVVVAGEDSPDTARCKTKQRRGASAYANGTGIYGRFKKR